MPASRGSLSSRAASWPNRACLARCALVVFVGCLLSGSVLGAEAKKDAPRVTGLAPLAVSPGTTTTVKLVGVKVNQATTVLIGDAALAPAPATQPSTAPRTAPATAPATTQPATSAGARAKITGSGKVDVPKGMEAAQVGDASVDVEVVIPPDAPEGELPITLVTPSGATAPVRLLIASSASLADEKEPNNGFREAQPIEPGKRLRGSVQSPGDVDVFRITGRSGQTLLAEVTASRRHSLLDSLLTLYDERGNVLAENDDGADSSDSLLRFTLPSDGVYFLCLTDANDRGNAGFSYLLSVKLEGK